MAIVTITAVATMASASGETRVRVVLSECDLRAGEELEVAGETLLMPFKPQDLQPYQLPPGSGGAHRGEAYSREALRKSVPEADREAYIAAADKWVEDHGGHRIGDERDIYMVTDSEDIWAAEGR
jgi:hypothetical protein